MTKIIKYSYQQLVPELDLLTKLIIDSGWTPTVILGVSRGGLVPAVMLSHFFDIPLYPYHISLRDHVREGQINLKLIWKENVLVVDDICATGAVLDKLHEYIHGIVSSVKYATLHYTYDNYNFIPNFYLNEIGHDEWVEYPWENWWKND